MVIDNRLIIRFEIGNYWLENSYDYTNGKEELDAQVSLDKKKFLKRLSESILESAPGSESVDLDSLLGASEETQTEEIENQTKTKTQ